MKRLFILSLFSVLLIMGTITILQGGSPNYIAKAKLVKGKVYIIKLETKKKTRLKINQKIPMNSEIITSPNSTAILFLKGGALVEIKEKSILRLNKSFINKNNTSLSLIKGRSKFKIRKLLKNSKFNVYTPTAVVGVRGTEYEIQLADDGSLGVNVDDGKIAVESDKENKVLNKNSSAEVDLENPAVIVGKKKNLDKWNNNKRKEIKERPVTKTSVIKNELLQTKENQEKLLNDIKNIKKDRKKAESKEFDLFKNLAKTEGLFKAAQNIKKANKHNKKVSQMYKTIKKIHSTLERLNRTIENKFNKLDEYYNKKSKELDEKYNNLDRGIDSEIDKKFENFDKGFNDSEFDK